MSNNGVNPNKVNQDETTPLGCALANWQNNYTHSEKAINALKKPIPSLKENIDIISINLVEMDSVIADK